MSPAPKIFISYRRSDSGGHAAKLIERLHLWFDKEVLFYDQSGIDRGAAVPAEIEAAINRAAVVLVVIGPDWLTEINRRVSQSGLDFVRLEVVRAMAWQAKGKSVLPVLMGGATLPEAHQLHPSMQLWVAKICALKAHVLQGSDAAWDTQFVRLRERIAAVCGVPAPRFRRLDGTAQSYRVIAHSFRPPFHDPNGLQECLRQQLLESGNGVRPAPTALCGMGGVGKSQLALKYCRDFRDAYAGIWWFCAETEMTLQLSALDACKTVGATMQPGELPTAVFRRWLAQQTTGWLLVYGNAEDVAALRPHLPDPSRGGPHHILITSHNPAWDGVARTIELKPWTPEQGAEFLATRLSRNDPEQRLQLAHDLDGLPLALVHAASYIKQTRIKIADYRALLVGADSAYMIRDGGKSRAATYTERRLAATLLLSFDKHSAAAVELLRLLAFAAPAPLPERFLCEAVIALRPALAAAATDDLLWGALVTELHAYNLAERLPIFTLALTASDFVPNEGALTLHRLTRQIIRARLAQPGDIRRLEAVLYRCCPQVIKLPELEPRFATLVAHITQLDHYHAGHWLDNPAYIWLLDRVASYLQIGPALYAESAHWFNRKLEIRRQELGENPPNTIVTRKRLTSLKVHQGEDLPNTLADLCNLIITFLKQGDLLGADKLLDKVPSLIGPTPPEEYPATLKTINTLAHTLWNLTRFQPALMLMRSTAEHSARVLGPDHPDTIASRYTADQWQSQINPANSASGRTLH